MTRSEQRFQTNLSFLLTISSVFMPVNIIASRDTFSLYLKSYCNIIIIIYIYHLISNDYFYIIYHLHILNYARNVTSFNLPSSLCDIFSY